MPRQRMIFWAAGISIAVALIVEGSPWAPTAPTWRRRMNSLAGKVIVFRRLSSLLNGRRLLPYFSSSDLRFSFGSRRAAGITGWLLGVTSIVGGGPLGGNGSNACSRSFV